MICPKCLVQMHQKDKVGGGVAEETIYTTWELKECLGCKRMAIEFYYTELVTTVEDAQEVAQSILNTIRK